MVRGSPSVTIIPTLDSSSTLAATRPTKRSFPVTSWNASCWTPSAPMFQRPARPVSFTPASISTGWPVLLRPILREKKGMPFRSRPPKENISTS